jgi:putative transposase
MVHTSRSFQVETMVVLPDHLHCIWPLPPGIAGLRHAGGISRHGSPVHCDPFFAASDLNSHMHSEKQPAIMAESLLRTCVANEDDFARHVDTSI